MFQVLFIDIGLEDVVEFSELRRLRGVSAKYIDIPSRVFECRLACLQPSELFSDRYRWETPMKEFKRLTYGNTVSAEVRSNTKIPLIVKCRFKIENLNVSDLLS